MNSRLYEFSRLEEGSLVAVYTAAYKDATMQEMRVPAYTVRELPNRYVRYLRVEFHDYRFQNKEVEYVEVPIDPPSPPASWLGWCARCQIAVIPETREGTDFCPLCGKIVS